MTYHTTGCGVLNLTPEPGVTVYILCTARHTVEIFKISSKVRTLSENFYHALNCILVLAPIFNNKKRAPPAPPLSNPDYAPGLDPFHFGQLDPDPGSKK